MYHERHKVEVHNDVEIFKKKTQFDSSCFNVIRTLLENSELQFSFLPKPKRLKKVDVPIVSN